MHLTEWKHASNYCKECMEENPEENDLEVLDVEKLNVSQ